MSIRGDKTATATAASTPPLALASGASPAAGASAVLMERLTQAVRRVCPSWLSSERDDLVQTALIKILERERRTGTQQQLEKAYLYRVAHSVMVDEIRSRKRKREEPLGEQQPDGEREVR